MQDILEKAARVKLIIFDVDGVLTDGALFLCDDGKEYKAFNSRDGHGFRMLREGSDVEVAIITGRSSRVVSHRMEELGIQHVYQGQRDKRQAFQELLAKTGISAAEVAYVGDDVVDLPIMSQVGLAICVQDAHPFVKKHSDWITPHVGGRGAGRDVVEMILQARGRLDEMLASYISE
ncbi:MAG: 3-deoxy-manno-octulosonate-8-phosphatase KdsC [Gammaproteobacteria bacterium]|nr:3-deoxy-manno-octulosonate-8-phosphatase KdsC [Gammaproteobacteria bacterium]